MDTLVWTGALIALVLALRGFVTRQFGPNLAYALWLLPFARLFLPPIVLPAWLAPDTEVALTRSAAALPVTSPEALVGDYPAMAPAEAAFDFAPLLLAIWLGGAAVLIAWRLYRYRNARDMIRANSQPVGEADGVALIESPLVAAPLAFGVRDKVIALPVGYIDFAERDARDLAIAHELAHHRANDILVNFAAQPLFALHWFNPLGWLGWRALRRDQEAACDMRVVTGAAPRVRALYAETIASFAGTQGMANSGFALAAPMACPVLGEKSVIHRLRNLAMKDVSPARQRAGRWLLGTAALALPLTASISYAAAEREGAAMAVHAPVPPAPPAPPAAPPAPDARFAPAMAPEPPAPPQLRGQDVDLQVSRRGDGELTVVRDGRTYTGDAAERALEAMEADMERDMANMERDIEIAVQRAMDSGVNAEEIRRLALARAREGLISVRTHLSTMPELNARERAQALREIDEAIAELDAEQG